MATYYVAKTGNDSTGDGSSGSPWKTLNKAIATVPAGTAGSPNVIILKNGNYNMTAGEGISASVQSVDITKANLIVKAETRKGVVLRGDWGPALLRTNGYTVPCAAWDDSTPWMLPDPASYFGKGVILDIHAAGVTVDGIVVECVACEGIRWSAGDGSTIQYCVTYWTLEQGINAITAAAGNFGNESLFGSNISLLYNEVYMASTCRLSPVWVCAHQGGNKARPDPASGALRFGSIEGPGLVKGNIVAYSFGEGYDIGKRAYGTVAAPVIVEDNVAHDNRHVQMYILHGRHVHFRNNRSYTTQGHSIFNVGSPHGGNCYTVRDEQIDELPATDQCFIYNNIGVNSDSLINVGNNPGGTPVPKTNLYIGFNTLVSGVFTDSAIRLGGNNTGIFENNIIHHGNAGAGVPMTVSGGSFTIRRNAYSQSPTGRFVNGSNIIGGLGLPEAALTDLRTSGWNGPRPGGFYDTYADFIANVSDNFDEAFYHLVASSPCKDAAVARQAAGALTPPIEPFQVDYRGRTRTAPDLGWYEVGGANDPVYQAAFSRNPTALGLDTGTAVAFTNESSYANTTLTGYTWTVKKAGVTVATATTTHYSYTFTSAGSYTVALRIDTAAGNDTETVTYTISDPAGEPSVTAAFSQTPAATTVAKGTIISFVDESVYHNAAFVSRQWQLKSNPGGAVLGTWTAATLNYGFATAGTFDVVLTVTATGGLTDSETVTIVVTDPTVPHVTAAFTSSDADLTVVAGNAVTFTNTSTASNCTITGYVWSVLPAGGGAEENFTSTNLAYTFRQVGQWIVSLRANTDADIADVAFAVVTVLAAPPAGGSDLMVAPVLFAANTSTGTQTVTAAALGSLVPKGVHFKLVGGTAVGTAANDALWGEGAASASAQWAFARMSQNGQSGSVAKRRKTTAACLMTIDAAGAVTGLASFVRFVAGGVEIDVSDAFPAGYRVEATFYAGEACEFWAGNGIAGAAGSDVVVATGIDQDVVYLASPWAATDAAESDAEFSRGWALKTGAQMAFRNEDRDAASPTAIYTRHHLARVGTSADGSPGPYVGIEVNTFTATGLTVRTTTNALNRQWFAFAFTTGTARVQLTTETLSTGASSSHAIGFEAQTVMALVSTMRTADTQLAGADAAGQGWFCQSVHGGYANTQSIASSPAVVTSSTRSLAAAGFCAVSHDGTNLWNGTPTLDTDSLDIAWSAAPGYGYKMILLAIEVGATIVTPPDPDTPVADFTADVREGDGRLAAWLDASTSNGNGYAITSYAWDFGDGQTVTEATPGPILHVYEYPGDYDVSLTVTTSAGSDTKTAAAFVRVATVEVVEHLIGLSPPDDIDGVSESGLDDDGHHTHRPRLRRLPMLAMSADDVSNFLALPPDPVYALWVWDDAEARVLIKRPDGTHRAIATTAVS